MKPPFKHSADKIAQELYNSIRFKQGDLPHVDKFISILANDYFSFQESLFKALEGKTSITFKDDKFIFNNLFEIKDSRVILTFDTTKEQKPSYTKSEKIGMKWSGTKTEGSSTSLITPPSTYFLDISGSKFSYREHSAIVNYFYEHLKKLDEKCYDKLSHVSEFIKMLHDTSVTMKNSGLDIRDMISNQYHSNVSIYNILKENKDIISLTSDSDILPHLEAMKKYHASNKVGVSLK